MRVMTILFAVLAVIRIDTMLGMVFSHDRQAARIAEARTDVEALVAAIELLQRDHGTLPGSAVDPADSDPADSDPADSDPADNDPATNAFPRLYRALQGYPPGSGPYVDFRREDIVVLEEDDGYATATEEQLRDSTVEKLYLDPWGEPYYYRVNTDGSRCIVGSAGPNLTVGDEDDIRVEYPQPDA